jgi:fructosamine-3-kinase
VIAGDTALAQAQDVARTILGAPVEVNHFVGGGCNSRIYKVRFEQREFALKQYPLSVGNSEGRLAAEVGALRLMERHRVDGVPRVVGVDQNRGYALLTWIDGSTVREPTNADVDAALAFLDPRPATVALGR